MSNLIEFKKGEGMLTIKKLDDGIQLHYGCIDDSSKKIFTTDELMEMLGYKVSYKKTSKSDNEKQSKLDGLYNKIVKIISEEINIDIEDINPNSFLIDELGCDSLDLVEIQLAIEDKFNIETSDEKALKVKTVYDVVEFARKYIELSK